MTVVFKKLHPKTKAPKYQTKHSVGADLYACIDESIVIKPHDIAIIGTGIAVAIPNGYEGQVRMRSSLGARGLCLVNGVGTIDPDYRGEIKMIVANISDKTYVIEPFERIGQLVICPAIQAMFWEANELPESERGEGGFGSTGRF